MSSADSAAYAEEGESRREARKYSKTEESVAFSIRRPSQPHTEDIDEKPSASLTIGQREGDSGEQEDVQLSQSITTKRKSRKTKQMSPAAQRDEEGEVSEDRRYSKTEESVAFSIRKPSLPQTTDTSDLTSASLTIGRSADADEAISRDDGEEVQVSLGIKKVKRVKKTGYKKEPSQEKAVEEEKENVAVLSKKKDVRRSTDDGVPTAQFSLSQQAPESVQLSEAVGEQFQAPSKEKRPAPGDEEKEGLRASDSKEIEIKGEIRKEKHEQSLRMESEEEILVPGEEEPGDYSVADESLSFSVKRAVRRDSPEMNEFAAFTLVEESEPLVESMAVGEEYDAPKKKTVKRKSRRHASEEVEEERVYAKSEESLTFAIKRKVRPPLVDEGEERSESPSTAFILVEEPEEVYESQAVGEEYDMKVRGSSLTRKVRQRIASRQRDSSDDDYGRSSAIQSSQEEVHVVKDDEDEAEVEREK